MIGRSALLFSSVLPTPGRWAVANDAPKQPREVSLVGQAACECDFAERCVCLQDQLLGVADPARNHIGVWRAAKGRLEGASEVVVAETDERGEFRRRQSIGQVRVYMPLHARDLPGRQPAGVQRRSFVIRTGAWGCSSKVSQRSRH